MLKVILHCLQLQVTSLCTSKAPVTYNFQVNKRISTGDLKEVMKLLMEHGADPNIRSFDNKSAYDIVKEYTDRLNTSRVLEKQNLENVLSILEKATKKQEA
jgi:hypothetical protein